MIVRYPYLEERAAGVRLAARITGCLSTRGGERVLAWARPLISVRRCRAREAKWRPGRDGYRLLVPSALGRYAAAGVALHELAHPLLDVRLTDVADDLLRTAGEDERERCRRQRAKVDRWQEELADELVLALRLPSRLVLAIGDAAELSRETGLPWEVALRRVRTVGGHTFDLTYLPRWCAAWRYHLAYHPGLFPALALCEGSEVRLWVPTGGELRERRRLALQADLVALKPAELLAKYRRFRVDPEGLRGAALRPRCLAVDLAELRARAGWDRRKER